MSLHLVFKTMKHIRINYNFAHPVLQIDVYRMVDAYLMSLIVLKKDLIPLRISSIKHFLEA